MVALTRHASCVVVVLSLLHAGAYKLPWDMTTLSHEQYNPLWMLGRTASFMREATRTLNRRIAGSPEQVSRRR